MNSLSWLIYAAEVSPRIGTLAVLASVIFAIVGFIGLIVGLVHWDRGRNHTDDDWAQLLKLKALIRSSGRNLLLASPILMIFGLVLPSSTTIYMVAASEVGERVVTSPETVEAMNDLKAIIKKRLKDVLAE